MYAEVYNLLNILGTEYINKIPKKMYDFIDESRDKSVLINIDINLPIESQNISDETIEFISLLNLKYWCTENEKIELQKIYDENERKYQQKLKENLEKSFNSKNKNIKEQHNEQLELVLIKNTFIYKIMSKIKKFFTKR